MLAKKVYNIKPIHNYNNKEREKERKKMYKHIINSLKVRQKAKMNPKTEKQKMAARIRIQ